MSVVAGGNNGGGGSVGRGGESEDEDNGNEWTEEEQSDVLKFYGIETFNPNEWIELDKELQQRAADAANEEDSSDAPPIVIPSSLLSARQLLQEDKDPLGLFDAVYVQKNQALGDAGELILLSQKKFNPQVFLKEVHDNTGYDDLLLGCSNLQEATEQRNETLKNLVKQNFDRFVNAKNSIEVVYEDMKSRALTVDDCGTKKGAEALAVVYTRVQEVYRPLLARRSLEETIRKRLAVFDRYKFIFGLVNTMKRSMQLGEYQTAVHDYRKGKTMLSETSAQLRRVLEKVWASHVERAASALREELFKKLANTIFSFDVHAKMIGYLLDMDAHPDPILTYFNIGKNHVITQIRVLTEKAMCDLKELEPENDMGSTLKMTLKLVQSHDYEAILNLDQPAGKLWHTHYTLYAGIGTIIKNFTGPFSKFTKALMSGQFAGPGSSKAASGDSKRSYNEYARVCSEEIEKAIEDAISTVLSKDTLESVGIVDNAAIAVVYGLQSVRVMGEMVRLAIKSRAHPSLINSLVTAFNTATKTVLSRIWTAALVESKHLGKYEEWDLTGEGFDFSTSLLKSFEVFMLFLVKMTSTISQSFFEVVSDSVIVEKGPAATVSRWLVDVLNGFVKGLQELVTPAPSPEEPSADLSTTATKTRRRSSSGANIEAAPVEASNEAKADAEDKEKAASLVATYIDRPLNSLNLRQLNRNYQLLTVMTNVIYMKRSCLQRVFASLTDCALGNLGETAFQEIFSTMEEVDRSVSQMYLQTKQSKIISTIQSGIIMSTFDWSTQFPPKEVRPFVFDLLLELVAAQTEICDISQIILRPLMSELVVDIFQEILKCFQAVRHFGAGGYLQAKLEVDFLHQKLTTVLNAEAMTILEAIDSTLSMGAGNLQPDPAVLSVALKKLQQTEKASMLQFGCFQYT